MSILNHMPMKFIKEFVSKGGHLSFGRSYVTDEVYLDLNTGMKSDLHLYYIEERGYVAKCRYDYEEVITYFSDLHYAIRKCMHGKGFMSSSITEFYQDGFEDMDEEFC